MGVNRENVGGCGEGASVNVEKVGGGEESVRSV